MGFYISQIIQGIAAGSLYGLLGLSMMFIYRSTRVFNFAQGEMANSVSFMAMVLFKYVHPAIAFALACVFAFVFGAALEIGIMNRVRGRGDGAAIITTIGLYAIINSFISWKFGFDPYPFPSPFPDGGVELKGVFISYQSLGILACTMFVSMSLHLFFRYTLLGIGFQAISEDPVAAELKGVRVGVLVALAWGISTVIAGLAGMLAANTLFLHPYTMGPVLLYAFASAVIGGLQSSFGALVGGICVGIIENLAGTLPWVGSEMKTVVVFFVLLIFLLVRPRGLFGRNEPRKI
jgi:branched-chain amino acid transport system permease protein